MEERACASKENGYCQSCNYLHFFCEFWAVDTI